jgi:ribosome-associated translation inhibitor RaiA
MRVNVVAQQFTLTPAIGAWVHQQIAANLTKHSSGISGIDVYVTGANGPRGGEGVSATITVSLKHLSPVRITSVHADLFSAIAISAKRCGPAVSRALVVSSRPQRSAQIPWQYDSADVA